MREEAFAYILVGILFPIFWLVSEFYKSRILRITLGFLSLIVCCGLVYAFAWVVSTLNYNAWYGFASKDLIHTIVTQLDAGNRDHVIVVLKKLDSEYEPTYENRARYDQLIERTVNDMKASQKMRPESADGKP